MFTPAKKPPLSREPFAAMAWDVREEFELACIREFSHSGLYLGIGLSSKGRRERIRAAILRENKAHLCWRSCGFTYATMFEQAYSESLGASGVRDQDSDALDMRRREPSIDDEWVDDEEALERDKGFLA
jgi:hypothetical protein